MKREGVKCVVKRVQKGGVKRRSSPRVPYAVRLCVCVRVRVCVRMFVCVCVCLIRCTPAPREPLSSMCTAAA